MTGAWTINKVLSWTESYFTDHGIDSPRLTSEILLAYSLGIKRLDLYLKYDQPLQQDELSCFKTLIKRRVQNEPVAYITGIKGFFESEFEVEQGILIPRPDTETIVEAGLELLNSSGKDAGVKRVLELGTGSGAIIISLAKAAPGHFYFANDISGKAVGIAQKNSGRLIGKTVNLFAGDWFSSLKKNAGFDLIVSNPPYIPSGDIQSLQPEIRDFEPLLALDGGIDGLDCLRSIIDKAHGYLAPGGVLLLEMGFDQKEGVRNICKLYDQYISVDFIKDLAGYNRVAVIKKN